MRLLISSPHEAPRVVELVGSELHLGRGTDNDISFGEDAMLSRRHLCFRSNADAQWFVRDCGSRNGTTLNNIPLTQEHLLNIGDHLVAGHLTVEVTLEGWLDPQTNSSPTILTSLRELSPSELDSTRAAEALIEAGKALAVHQSLDQLFETILDNALKAVRSRRGVLMTDEDGILHIRAARGIESTANFKLSQTVENAVMGGKQSLVISDMAESETFRGQDSIIAQNVKSILAVPLQTGSAVLGLLYLDNGWTPGSYTRADLELITVMANIAAIRLEHARLALVEERDKLLQAELEGAAEIQRGLLPPSLGVPHGYEIVAEHLPCRAVGGDYYDLLPYPDGRFALLVADVCGKGLPASLMMASLQARIQVLAETIPEPARALETLNRSLAPRFPPGRFITVIYVLVQPQTGHITYANAGHNHPILIRATGSYERLEGGNLVLALLPDSPYEDHEAVLDEGDLLCLFSDGISESAPRGSSEHYGEDRLAAWLTKHRTEPLGQIWTDLQAELRQWSQTPWTDDVTLVLLRRQTETNSGFETLLQ